MRIESRRREEEAIVKALKGEPVSSRVVEATGGDVPGLLQRSVPAAGIC